MPNATPDAAASDGFPHLAGDVYDAANVVKRHGVRWHPSPPTPTREESEGLGEEIGGGGVRGNSRPVPNHDSREVANYTRVKSG